MAVLGQENEGGRFCVEEYCYSELPYQPQPDIDSALAKGEDRYVKCEKIVLGTGTNVNDFYFQFLPFFIAV